MTELPIPPFIHDDLARMDALIAQRMESQAAVIRAAGRYLVGTGSKNLRAALTLLAARLGPTVDRRVLNAAATVELIHTAMLVHDDLVDDATRRHGTSAADTRWNGDVALMVGDYMLALAASEMALAPDPRIIDYFSRSVMAISEGALAPVMVATPPTEAVEQYLYAIGSRTAALFEAGCKVGMVCGSGTQSQIDALGRFGFAVGMAFQIADDARDLESTLGAGVITLPLIYAFERGADPRLAALIEQDPPDVSMIGWAADEIRRVGGVAQAFAEARRYLDQALAQLNLFPDSAAKQALATLARHTVEQQN